MPRAEQPQEMASAPRGPTTPHQLSSTRLPEDASLLRHMPLPEERRNEKYIQRFDARTLVYDCFLNEKGTALVFVAPRFLNLWKPFRAGLQLNGTPVGRRLRRRKSLRSEILTLPLRKVERGTPLAELDLQIEIAGQSLRMPISDNQSALFEGRNCLMTLLQNTPLDWIEKWVRYHVAAHGVDAVLIYDNDSSAPKAAKVLELVRSIEGVEACMVVEAPFPYGAPAGGRLVAPAMYLQTALLNLARVHFLKKARGVLSIDVDEMVRPIEGSTVFNEALKSKLGLVSFQGRWAFPRSSDAAQAQDAHSMTDTKLAYCRPKWCAAPQSLSAYMDWQVHQPGGVLFHFTNASDIKFWHCAATSNGWKGNRSEIAKNRVESPEMIDDFARFLPE